MNVKRVENPMSVAEMIRTAKTEEEKQVLANSDMFMVAEIEGKTVFMHEAVWAKENRSLIPSNKLVFHKDGDPMNNDPENLDIVDSTNDLHISPNRVFHENTANREFIKEHFDDVYDAIWGQHD